MPKEGVFARVIKGGDVKTGDAIEIKPGAGKPTLKSKTRSEK